MKEWQSADGLWGEFQSEFSVVPDCGTCVVQFCSLDPYSKIISKNYCQSNNLYYIYKFGFMVYKEIKFGAVVQNWRMRQKKQMLKSSPRPVQSSSQVPSAKRYSAHRERQQRRILAAAQELFDKRGFDKVTLAEIVKATGIRPMTLYEYFANKDEIIWALVEEYHHQTNIEFQERLKDVGGNTLAKITAMLEAFGQELIDHPERVRFQAQFDAMYGRDGDVGRLLAIEDKFSPDRMKVFTDLISDGIGDGSLREDLHPKLTIHAVLNSVIGTQRRLASLGNKVEKEYGQPISELFRESVRVILLGLAKPKPRKPK